MRFLNLKFNLIKKIKTKLTRHLPEKDIKKKASLQSQSSLLFELKNSERKRPVQTKRSKNSKILIY